MKQKKLIIILGIIVLLVLFIFPSIIRLFSDWLWFLQVGFQTVFTTILGTQIISGLVVGIIAFGLIYLNLKIAHRLTRSRPVFVRLEGKAHVDIGKYVNRLILPASLIFGFFTGLIAQNNWQTVLQYFNATSFGTSDPIFGRDISFYFFSLPLLKLLIGIGFWIVIVSLIGVVLIYFIRGAILLPKKILELATGGLSTDRQSIKGLKDKGSKIHVSLLLAFIFLLLALRAYFIRIPDLLYSTTGPFVGASFTDIHATLPILKIIATVSLLGVILALLNIYRPTYRFILLAFGLYFVASLVGGFYPIFIQKFIVVPNELTKESPYIAHNIAGTQAAWGLDRVEKRDLSAETALTMEDIKNNELTIKNIRLWDREPLLDTFSQIQEIRTYYDFISVDNDRYMIDGEYRQVMLSPRELNSESLPHRTFINERFTFTHGFGLTLGPVNQVTEEGLPVLFIKDLPPVSTIKSINVSRPEIYFGELSSDYVFVKTKAQEFDYPKGEENVFTTYEGDGGVKIDSLFKKILFAIRFSSLKILLSGDLTPESQILYYRNIKERVNKVLPFLRLDSDPYLVVTDEGKLKWIYDVYTESSYYPYAQNVEDGINYMRNAVKVVIDPYDGKMQFYIADEKDPVISTYAKIFKGVFLPLSQMPQDLKMHLRYPEDIFAYQTELYRTYHMEQPQIFYNKEDVWEIPRIANEKGKDPIMRHLIMKLPGELKEEFILMIPFTPRQKDNMSAWMVARSDGEQYGKLVVYRFPKQRLVFGPKQMINRINQDPEISRQISLWDQRGSEVIQGNLLVIPIEESLLYVRPLYLRAEGGKIPELKRVIVAYENKIVMEETLDVALQKIFGGEELEPTELPKEEAELPKAEMEVLETKEDLARRAKEHFDKANEAQREGDWATYGEELRKLGEILEQLSETKTD
jgi:uncharacterized membrane protein (UPF0182 family)